MNYPGGGEGNILIAVGNNATTVNYWLFDNTGNLRLPGNTFAVNYANGTQVSLGGGGSNISNGNSNVSIATANGNVTIAAIGNTTMTVTGTGANITGTLDVTGNVTANNFIGNGAQLTDLVQGLIKPNNLLYVAKNGNDTAGTGSINAPYLTIQAAIDASASETATTIILAPGNYVGNLVINNVANSLNITGSGLAESAINGNITISGTSNNIEFDNLRIETGRVTHSATGYWSVINSRFSANTGITKTSSSTIKLFNTDLGAAGTGSVLLQGGKTNIYSSQVFNVQVSGANTEVNFLQCDTVILPTVISGNVNFIDTNMVSSGTGNSLNAVGGYVTLKNCLSITPLRTLAPIGFGAGTSYSYGDSGFDVGNSTFAGTAIIQPGQFQAINVRGGNVTTNGLVSATGNITGNFFIGNGSQLTGIAAASSYGNANVVANLAALGSNPVSTTGNVNGGNILTGGLISATGNITGDNLITGAGSGGNLTGANVIFANTVTASANITGGNILTAGLISVTGNITGGNILGGANVNATTHTGTTVSVSANVTGGNILTAGLISATSTITSAANITGGNILTGGLVSATGNVTSGNILTAGLISATGNVSGGNLNVTGNIVDSGALTIITGSNGNIALAPNGTGIVTVSSNISAVGNISGGNLLTAGLITATGNITGGNLITGGLITATGNITSTANVSGGNLITAGLVTVTGNITGGNIITAGLVSATGNVSGGNLNVTGNIVDTGALTIITAASGNINLAPNGTTVLIATTTGIVGNVLAATTTTAANNVGYLGLPQNATGTATLTIADAGRHIYVTSASQTITIPANASVAFPIGTAITFIAGPSATTVSIAITTDTMYLAGTGTTGTRTLAAYGMATAVKVASTTWFINGTGLT
jgi:hypothetical protein